jgi:agmatinase
LGFMSSFPFLSQTTFARSPGLQAHHLFGIAGVAWDGSVTNRPGARMGPRAIREVSHMLCDATHPWFNVDLEGALGDAGDLLLPNTSLANMRKVLPVLARPLIERHHMAWLGGDHSITLPLLRMYREFHGRPLAVVHFDAHCDTWADHFGEPSGHGTWVAEAINERLVEPLCFTQIGIRSAAERYAREFVRDRGGQIFTARSLRGMASDEQLGPVLHAIRTRWLAAGQPPLYLSLDIDCLDPAYAPGTGTPEAAGLSSSQVFTLVEGLCELPFVGMDCVEVSPPYDHAEITSLVASQLVWTYLCGQRALLGH